MPKSRLRKLTLERRSIAKERAAIPGDIVGRRVVALENQAYELTKGFGDFVNEVNAALGELQDQLAELNLRVMFTMDFMKFGRKNPNAIVVPGQPDAMVQQTLAEIYMKNRAAFAERVQAEMEKVDAEIRAAQARAEAEASAATSDEHGAVDLSTEPSEPRTH